MCILLWHGSRQGAKICEVAVQTQGRDADDGARVCSRRANKPREPQKENSRRDASVRRARGCGQAQVPARPRLIFQKHSWRASLIDRQERYFPSIVLGDFVYESDTTRIPLRGGVLVHSF